MAIKPSLNHGKGSGEAVFNERMFGPGPAATKLIKGAARRENVGESRGDPRDRARIGLSSHLV